MKKIVSLLVALAMVLSLSVTAFATSGTGFQDDPYVIESLNGGFEMTAGTTWMDSDVFYKYVAEKTGTILTDAASGVWFSVNDVYGFSWVNTGDTNVEVAAGDTLYINFCNTSFSPITAYVYYEDDVPAGANPGGGIEAIPNGGELALGDNNVELTYATMPMMAAHWTYTATQSGYLTVTVDSVNGNTLLDMAFGRGMYTLLAGETDGMGTNTVTVAVNAGETVNIAVLDTMDFDPVPAVLNLTMEMGAPSEEKNPADYFETADNGDYLLNSLLEPVELFVGNDDIYFYYVAEQDGQITLTPSVTGYEISNCAFKINDGFWAYGSMTAQVSAGDIVRINIWQGWEGTAQIGEATGGADVPENGIAIEAYGNAEWTAPADGYVTFTINVPGATLAILNGYSPLAEGADAVTVQVTAGVTYGVYPGYNVTVDSIVTWEYVDGPAGGGSGDVVEAIPNGGALALGNNNVTLQYAMIPMQAASWTYTATEGGFLTVTVESINGETNLGMAFGRGFYTLLAGETDGMGTNMATVYVAAGETINIAVLDTMDMDPVPAVLNLSFEAGEPIIEITPDDYYEKDSDGNYIIPSLEYEVYIFSGNNDVYYIYTAEADGVVTFTATVDGYEATNAAIQVNGGSWDWSANPTAVSAGDVVIINIWGGNEGNVSLTAGGNAGGEQGAMSGSNIAISDTEAIEFFFTPDADGILTLNIEANPGFKFWVYETATDATLSLPQSGTADSYQYEVCANTEYRIYIIGYYEWSEVAATVSYEATFQTSELNADLIEIDESTTELVEGEQNVELLPNTTTTLFNFYAPVAGVYTITVPEGMTLALYTVSWFAYETAEGNTLAFTATADGQGFLIGLSGAEDAFNVSIEKNGDYIPEAPTTYENYEPTCPVDEDFEMPDGTVNSIDITVEQTIVLGNDGYYHLGSFDGPVILVNLNSAGFALAALYDAGAPITMRGEKNEGFCYDYMSMITGNYYSYSQEQDYIPLNADLMAFFKDYGAAQGWYKQGLSSFDVINAGGFNEESAWLAAMVYVDGFNGSATGPNAGQGGEGGDNVQTGDFGIIAATVALSVSAIFGTAVIAKKREF